jgi:hypothetical protein
MDMSGMDMGSGSGMDSAQGMLFRPRNQLLAQGYWYIIAGALGFTFIIRILDHVQASMRYVLFYIHNFQLWRIVNIL